MWSTVKMQKGSFILVSPHLSGFKGPTTCLNVIDWLTIAVWSPSLSRQDALWSCNINQSQNEQSNVAHTTAAQAQHHASQAQSKLHQILLAESHDSLKTPNRELLPFRSSYVPEVMFERHLQFYSNLPAERPLSLTPASDEMSVSFESMSFSALNVSGWLQPIHYRS